VGGLRRWSGLERMRSGWFALLEGALAMVLFGRMRNGWFAQLVWLGRDPQWVVVWIRVTCGLRGGRFLYAFRLQRSGGCQRAMQTLRLDRYEMVQQNGNDGDEWVWEKEGEGHRSMCTNWRMHSNPVDLPDHFQANYLLSVTSAH